ncbi:hypothetical protein GCM10023238_39360 [Streptomyces heliomycini]
MVDWPAGFPAPVLPEEFWEAAHRGRDAVTPCPRAQGHCRRGDGRRGAFLDDPAAFDAGHFGSAPRRRARSDPQARIIHELAHESLERADTAGPRRRGLRNRRLRLRRGDSGYPAGPRRGPPRRRAAGTGPS